MIKETAFNGKTAVFLLLVSFTFVAVLLFPSFTAKSTVAGTDVTTSYDGYAGEPLEPLGYSEGSGAENYGTGTGFPARSDTKIVSAAALAGLEAVAVQGGGTSGPQPY